MNSSFLTDTCYISRSTRRALETAAKLANPDGVAADADALAESVLRAFVERDERIMDLQGRIAKAIKEVKQAWEKAENPVENVKDGLQRITAMAKEVAATPKP